MSLLSRLQLAAAVLCSTDIDRHGINHLLVKDTTVTATNGSILLQVTRNNGAKEEDFPAVMPPTTEAPELKALGDILIHRDTAAAALKALPKKPPAEIMAHALLRRDAEGNLLLGTTNLDGKQVLTIKPFDGRFPNVDQIIPKREDGKFSIGLSPRLLGALCKYASQFDTYQPCLEFTFYDSGMPVRVDWNDVDHAAIGIVMPMRIGASEGMPVARELTEDVQDVIERARRFVNNDSDYTEKDRETLAADLSALLPKEEPATVGG